MSKSPSHHDDNENEGGSPRPRVLDDIQREVEEELENAQKVLSAADQMVAEGTSSRNHSRVGSGKESICSHPSQGRRSASPRDDPVASRGPSRPYSAVGSRQPSPRAPSRFDVAEGPSSHHSPNAVSAVGSRQPSPRAPSRFDVAEGPSSHHSPNAVSIGERMSGYRAPVGEDFVEAPAAENFERNRVSPRSGYGSRERALGEFQGSRAASRIDFDKMPGSYHDPSNAFPLENDEEMVAPSRIPSSARGSTRPSATSCRTKGSARENLDGSKANMGGGSKGPSPTGGSRVTSAVAFAPDNCRGGRSGPPSQMAVVGLDERGCSRGHDQAFERLTVPGSYYASCGPNSSPSPYSVANAGSSRCAGSQRNLYSQGPRQEGYVPFAAPPGSYTSPNEKYLTPSDPHHHTSGVDEVALQELSYLSGVRKGVPQRKEANDNFAGASSRCVEQRKKSNIERKMPKKPDLTPEEIQELIQREAQDVESAWRITSDPKKTYKKPCPKQQKAQMDVKHIVHAHESQASKNQICGKEYPPLIDPDPEDISIEVAAAMMFSQEQGIKLESCPEDTIKYLFPDDRRGPPFGDKIPANNVSVVDPTQKDQEELMEKSASVPSEGVSDSAYTKTMKMKGEDVGSRKSYDLDMALLQGKKERTWLSVLVPQKPQRFNKVQFRGNLPGWFPGYFSAFPDQHEGIKIVSSPSGLFQKAWLNTNPKNIPANDVVVVE